MSVLRTNWSIALLFVTFTFTTFILSPGLFILDEFIYFASAESVLNSNSFVVENGSTALNSDQLALFLLVQGPNGLVPQYPIGMAVLGAPLLGWFGMHGLMLINALSAAVTLIILYRISDRHFGGKNVGLIACALLICGTFFIEYAFAIWPHAVSVMCVTAAFLFVFEAIDADHSMIKRSLAIGGFIGFGLLFRTDTVLALPAIGLIVFLFTSKPIIRSILIGLGFLPFILIATIANLIKFGTLNPLSYGQTTAGDTNFLNHLPAITGLLLAGAILVGLSLSWTKISSKGRQRIIWMAAISIFVVAVAAHGFTGRYLHGFWGLVVDATILKDSRPGVVYLPNGTVAFWGFWKKAIGQSMPWMGLLVAALWRPTNVDRRVQLSILLLAVVWSLPFFPKDWHGGMSSNMRYFLPLVPLICALAAALLVQLCKSVKEPVRYLGIGALVSVIAVQLWLMFAMTHFAGINQILSTWLFLGTALLAIAWGFKRNLTLWSNRILLIVVGGGLTLSCHLAAFDFYNSQLSREKSNELSQAYQALPDKSLAYVPSRFLIGWALKPGHVAALPNLLVARPTETEKAYDFKLIDRALDQGFRVFVSPGYVTEGLRGHPGTRLTETEIGPDDGRLLELIRIHMKHNPESDKIP